ncbi:polyribonucleotide nucleotidyltransferase [Candidatus Roizmanbacteria bacterium RIFCSPHIGHO2_01_FULL_38_15]|nr:MAG: polyribonucleotide nucleotidyltransferase [Candidatus Roizmanbacteria bacterium RIFCSPHIGHO2_01_FULL_38_15]
MKILEESIDIEGQKLTLQFGKLAISATTSVFAKLGETCVLVTVTAGKVRDDLDYFPLHVEYAEKLYAGGIIKGSRWVKREGRPSDEAVLKGRLIDRSIRPLFPKGYKREVQIVITLLSVDTENDPEILAAIATSAALHVSPVPWKGPVSAVRVGYIPTEEKGEAFIVNPNDHEKGYSTLDLIVASTKEKIVMIEAGGEEIDETIFRHALDEGKRENEQIIKFIESLREKIGMPKDIAEEAVVDEKLSQILKGEYKKELEGIVAEIASKEFGEIKSLTELIEKVGEQLKDKYDKKIIASAIDYITKQMIREKTLKTKSRIDGRGPDDIRALHSEVAVLPRTHGTGIFQRGDTQVLSIATLGPPSLEQLIEGPEGQEVKRYIHHYYFPPYSVGEVGRIGFVSRREIGHGALAEKALEPVLPSEKDFPYTIRIVSEVLSSNGSTSMASTCGSTLALMDAGVPIKAAVAGIAMGLMSNSDDDYIILTDIMGIEDFSGEMDFKVAGTEKGITAVQLDVKNKGLTDKMIEEILERAKKARLTILKAMLKAISKSRGEVSKFAPKVTVITVPQDKIGEVIGPGGKTIRGLIAKTSCEINVDEEGNVTISGIDKVKVDEAAESIKNMTRSIEVGETFTGPVKRILPFGAFVEILPGKEGLVHVSKMGKGYVRDPADVVKIGQTVNVQVYQIDNQGRINLQMIEPARS